MNLYLTELEPTQEQIDAWERDYWNGEGHIEFFVIQKDPFEIEVIDYSGCAGGLDETCGIAYFIEHGWALHRDPYFKLYEGVTYRIEGLTVTWFRGDGCEIDDDVEYDFERIVPHGSLWVWLPHKIKMIWHRQVTCRFFRK